MSQTLSNFDEVLKSDYLPAIREQLNHETILMNNIQRNEESVTGKEWKMAAHYGRNSGVGARPDNGTLPTAGNQAYKNPYDSVKFNYARITVTGPTMKASRDNDGAFVQALGSEIEGAMRDLKKDINFQLFNDGTAYRALVNGDPGTGTTLTVDAPGTSYLSDGMLIDIVDPISGVPCTSSTDLVITSVDSSTACTMSAAINADVADNDVVVRAGSTDDAGTSYEMMGLKGIVDDATYVATLHHLARGTYAWWNCATHANDDNSGTNRDLTTSLMQDSFTAVQKLGGKVGAILTTFELRDAYAAELVSDKRFVNTLDLDGGFSGLEYNGIAVIPDQDALANTMLFVDWNHLFLFQMSDFDWMDQDGAVLSRVASSDSYEAVLYWYANLGTDRPRAHSFLRDVS